jgi:hypothetical protein
MLLSLVPIADSILPPRQNGNLALQPRRQPQASARFGRGMVAGFG